LQSGIAGAGGAKQSIAVGSWEESYDKNVIPKETQAEDKEQFIQIQYGKYRRDQQKIKT
jgi:hypothetical protein